MIRDILRSPQVYIAFQRLVGASTLRRRALDAARITPGMKVLDVGCGPAYYLDWLPDIDYVGYDTDQTYIDWASERFAGRGQFRCGIFGEADAEKVRPVDVALALGLLHHVDDDTAHSLLELLRGTLGDGGRLMTVDTCFHEGQARVARLLAEKDRGEHVRSADAFVDLAKAHFSKVVPTIVGDNSWIPQTYVMLEMSG